MLIFINSLKQIIKFDMSFFLIPHILVSSSDTYITHSATWPQSDIQLSLEPQKALRYFFTYTLTFKIGRVAL